MRFGSLFSGVGGMDLGLEQAGWSCAWQCELDPWRRGILARHWPEVERHADIHDLAREASVLAPVDLVAGGFPCPVVSSAARGRNTGPWLWPAMAEIVRQIRPRLVLVENVRLVRRRIGEILGDLARLGYDAIWRELSARDFGAPHHRPRLWLVAYANRNGEPGLPLDAQMAFLSELAAPLRPWSDPPEGLRVDDGIPDRAKRIAALGDSVMPVMARWIGERLHLALDP